MDLPRDATDDRGRTNPAEPSATPGFDQERALASPKFCGQCGAPWVPGAVECPRCWQRRVQPSLPAAGSVEGWRSLKSAIGLYFALLGVSIFGLIAGRNGADEVSLDFMCTGLMAALVLAWCLGGQCKTIFSLVRGSSPGALASAAALAPVTFLIAVGVVEGAHRAFGIPVIRYADPFLDAGYGWGMVFLSVAVVPAVVEELAFRGVMLQALQPLLTPTEAVFVSALMFMILHLSLASFPHTFLLGVCAGWLCVRTRSLLPGMLLHLLHNSLCVALEWAGLA